MTWTVKRDWLFGQPKITFQQCLESDEHFETWVNWNFFRCHCVRASAYSDKEMIHPYQELTRSKDPRRPVILKSNIQLISRKYRLKSGYALDVIERYVKFFKLTEIDIDKALRFIRGVENKIIDKGIILHCSQRFNMGVFFINGRICHTLNEDDWEERERILQQIQQNKRDEIIELKETSSLLRKMERHVNERHSTAKKQAA